MKRTTTIVRALAATLLAALLGTAGAQAPAEALDDLLRRIDPPAAGGARPGADSRSPADDPGAAPEGDSGFVVRATVVARRYMAVTANPHASRAADRMLAAGGSAVDAAIAAQMVLGLVEPQSSGIGGGAFLLHHSVADGSVAAFDGRETAPALADGTLFLDRDGRALRFHDAAVGGRSVGTPGVVRMLEAAHRRFGRLPWQSLFEPAIELAEQGFAISPRLHRLVSSDRFLVRDPTAAAYFLDPRGQPLPAGTLLRNPEYADTLRRIAAGGSLAFYEGPIAADIVAKVRTSGPRPGLLGHDDLRSYSAIERAPICRPFRAYEVCGMPPPSSGGIAVAQILGIVARLPRQPMLDGDGRLRADAVHQFVEAGRLAFADRERYVGDPAFVRTPAPPYDGLLDGAYLDARAQLVGPRSMGRAEPGRLAPIEMPMARGQAIEQPSTSHLSIVDADGNAVAMTTSIEDQFGARLMVRGFLLNNQLTDFSYDPRSGTQGAANRVEGGKRPRSAMAPTLVFRREAGGRRGPLVLAIGSPGGAMIINYVAQALIAMLDDGIDPGTALALPHFGSRNGPTELELERVPPAVARALEARGHALRYAPMTSGLHAIARDCRAETCLLVGAVDPRREGEALGR